jgi:hypothetical protein
MSKRRKVYFGPEAKTVPALARAVPPIALALSKDQLDQEEPPATLREGAGAEASAARPSRVRVRPRKLPVATVDEVTADLSRDPRREK